MMTTKKKITVLICLLFLTACDNRKDIFKKNVQENHVKLILNNKAEVVDPISSVLDSAKLNKTYRLAFDFKTTRSQQILLSVSDPAGLNFIRKTVSAKSSVDFLANKLGEYRLSFTISDTYSETESYYMNIVCFDNLPPVAVLKATISGNTLQLDGSESFDRDAIYGGGIRQYLFTISNESSSKSDVISQTDSTHSQTVSAGTYLIHLKVKDGETTDPKEGVWSDEVSVHIKATGTGKP